MYNTMKKFYLPLIAGAMALSFAACGGQKSANGRESVELTGAGATFPLPFYNMSFENYNATSGDKISYGGIGSGGGVRNLKDGIVDFAGSDAFLSDKEMAEKNRRGKRGRCGGVPAAVQREQDTDRPPEKRAVRMAEETTGIHRRENRGVGR
jgi:ABC-type phosphate transport system substrate-binding protein